MNESLDPTKENLNPEEVEIDKALRPLNFNDFNGQKRVIDNLMIFLEAANPNYEPIELNPEEVVFQGKLLAVWRKVQ